MARALGLLVVGILALAVRPGAAADDKEKKDQPGPALTGDEKTIFDLTNQERAKAGLPPLKLNLVLCKVARAHSANMAKQRKVDHVLDGKTPGQRTKDAGYRYDVCGENVGWGEKGWTAEQMVKWWMGSKAHRENILQKEFTEIGVGTAQNDKSTGYFTQLFATPQE